MRITIKYNEAAKVRKINFQMADFMDEREIRRGAKKVIRDRWPDISEKITDMEWRY